MYEDYSTFSFIFFPVVSDSGLDSLSSWPRFLKLLLEGRVGATEVGDSTKSNDSDKRFTDFSAGGGASTLVSSSVTAKGSFSKTVETLALKIENSYE